MTRNELDKIEDIFTDCINKEEAYAKRYAELNPDDAKARYNLFLERKWAMQSVWFEIKKRYEKSSSFLK